MPTQTQLEYILAVARLKHFGQAAEECHVSQPSLSMQIQKVEDILGFKIFDRNKKPIEVTPKGLLVVQQAQKVIAEYHRLLQISREESKDIKGDFHLGVIPTLSSSTLPLFVKAFAKKYPLINLFISEQTTDNIIQLLKAGNLDAGILATPLAETFIDKIVLFYESFFVYCSKDHPLLKKKQLKLQDLNPHHDLWLLSDGHCFKNQVLNFCGMDEAMTVFDNIHFQSGNLETLKQLVQKSQGYTFLPQLEVERMSSQDKKWVRPFVRPAPAREVSLVYNKGHWKMDVIQVLGELIQTQLPENLSREPLNNLSIMSIDNPQG
jgi:LysR family transcriptional regulator, hydrogen peroxide-inducible genes activator